MYNINKLSIQYISDIHLEFYDDNYDFNIIVHSPNLVLCGDIGYPGTPNYTRFIEKCSRLFKNVFVIFGNHEFYNPNNSIKIETVNDRKFYTNFFPSNVYFLDNNVLYLDVYTNNVYKTKPYHHLQRKNFIKIIGSTLWSDIDSYTASKMNDTNLIYIAPNRILTWQDIRTMYYNNINWIVNEIRSEKNINCVLLTHHAVHSIFLSNDILTNRRLDLKHGYYTDIPELYENANLLACICGHTHNSIKILMSFRRHNNTIYFLSNQVGYKHEKKVVISPLFGNIIDHNNRSKCLFEIDIS